MRFRGGSDQPWHRVGRALGERWRAAADLQDWLAFRLPGNELREQAFAGIRKLPRRQADAERMLRQGRDYFWDDLPQLGLEATPVVQGVETR